MAERAKKEKPIATNAIGFTLNRERRDEALQLIDTLTATRRQKGWRWVGKGNTQKQIAPEKIDAHKLDGWRLIN